MGLSKSKTKTQSQSASTSTPLDQYAPYINQGLTSAKGIMDANQGNMEMLGGKALDVANGFSAPNASLNSIYTGQSPSQATYGRLQNAGANDPTMGLLSHLAQGSTSPGQYDGIGQSNPALASLQGMTTQNNPALGILSGMTDQQANGDSAQFYKDTLSGKYLNGNPYLDSIVQQGTDAATKAQNARFAASGMDAGMSTPYAQALGSSVSDANNQLRYGAYKDELGRMGQIGGQSDAEYNATKDRSLSAANSFGSVYAGDQDRALQAATGLGSLYNQTGALNLSAQQAKDQAFNADRSNQLAATTALGSQYNSDNATSMAGANGDMQARLSALSQIPGMTSAQLASLQTAGSLPYTGLNSYAGLVNGLTGKYGNTSGTSSGTSTTSGSVMDALAKMGQAAGTAAIAFSDIRLKRDVERVGDLPDGLGVYSYRYVWDDEPQIGVMAHEVAAYRPWALGPEIGGYSTVDYGAL